MKSGMFVVSSYEIEGGIIRVGSTSPTNSAAKRSYTMDEAIAKLRRVLREMKEQDKTIYHQLMTLNSNIRRLKREIKGEEDVKRKFDMELEYDYESLDSDESCSDFDISDIDEDDMQIKQLVTNLSMAKVDKLEDADRDSVHERFDSGIQEDANYSIVQESQDTVNHLSPAKRAKKQSWNGERSSRYDFLLKAKTFSEGEDSHSSFDSDRAVDEKANGGDSPRDSTTISDVIEHDAGVTEPIVADENTQVNEDIQVITTEPDLESDHLLRRSHTMQPRKASSGRSSGPSKHRRTQSEDKIKLDVNSNVEGELKTPLSARERYHYRNLGQIAENMSGAHWNAFDARNYRSSERLPRKDRPMLKTAAKSQQFTKIADQNRCLNRSLTQLNLEGAISSNAIKAIKRSVSITNCSIFTMDTDRPNGCLKIPKGESSSYEDVMNDDSEIRLRPKSACISASERKQKYTSGFEVGYRTHPNGMVSSTISLV